MHEVKEVSEKSEQPRLRRLNRYHELTRHVLGESCCPGSQPHVLVTYYLVPWKPCTCYLSACGGRRGGRLGEGGEGIDE